MRGNFDHAVAYLQHMIYMQAPSEFEAIAAQDPTSRWTPCALVETPHHIMCMRWIT